MQRDTTQRAVMYGGTQARRHAGTQAPGHAGTQARRHAGTQARRHVGTQACTHARKRASTYACLLACLFACPFGCLLAFLLACPPACLSVCLSCMHARLSHVSLSSIQLNLHRGPNGYAQPRNRYGQPGANGRETQERARDTTRRDAIMVRRFEPTPSQAK